MHRVYIDCNNKAVGKHGGDEMDMNEKMAADIARQLGLSGGGVNQKTLKSLENKSDAELTGELIKIREKLKQNNISYEKQMNLVQSLMPMMKGEQRERLERVIKLLEK